MSYLSPTELAYQEAHIHEDRGPLVIISIAVLVVLASIAIFMRVCVRIITKVGFKTDDYLIFAAWILAWGGFVCAYYEARLGVGKHVISVDSGNFVKIVKATVFAGLDFFVSVMLTQLSILFLYKRTLTLYKIWFRNTLFVLGFFCVTNGIIITIGRLCRCRPLSYSWTRFETDENASFNANKGYCTPNMGYMWPAHAIVTLLIDTGLVVAPLPLIWGLQMSRATKQALAATFLLGIFVSIMNLVRLPALLNINNYDYTYTEVGAEIWTQAELNLGIVSACLPIFKPLYRKVKATVSALRTNDMSSNPQPHSKTLVYSYGVPGGKVPISKSQRVGDDMSDSHIDMELGTVIHVTRDFDVSSFGGKSGREFEQY